MATTFQLDTSGAVLAQLNEDGPVKAYSWSDLTPFAQGYIEAMFASAWDDAAFRSRWMLREVLNGTPEDQWRNTPPGFSDLAPETLARIIADCAEDNPFPIEKKEGRSFWENRQQGVLTTWPPLTVTLCDDGKVRFA